MSRRAAGLKAWILQRVSGLLLALYLIYFVALFLITPPTDYVSWLNWVANPLNSVGLLFIIFTLLIHAWIGFRDVLMDYVPIFSLRFTLLTLLAIGLSGCALWALRIVLIPLFLHQ